MNSTESESLKLEKEFLERALRRSNYQSLNDTRKANSEYEKIHQLRKRIRTLPDKGKSIFRRIARHSDPNVKVLAAASLLSIDEVFAIEILSEIADRGDGLVSLTAEMTICEWKNGSLREYLA